MEVCDVERVEVILVDNLEPRPWEAESALVFPLEVEMEVKGYRLTRSGTPILISALISLEIPAVTTSDWVLVNCCE